MSHEEITIPKVQLDFLCESLSDEQAARKIAGSAADRFRDVITEVLNLSENPGDDVLINSLRALHGKRGPEPTAFRDFCTGAQAHLEANGFRWQTDAAALRAEEGEK